MRNTRGIRGNVLGVKLNFRYFIRDGVTSIIFIEMTLKQYFVEVVDITYNIQYLRISEFTCTHDTFYNIENNRF